MIGLWIVTQVLSGFGSLGQDGGGVAYWAHIGGFVAGLVLTFLLRGMVRPRAAGAPAGSRRILR
jgi:membrane associated rhomboid family serine protease